MSDRHEGVYWGYKDARGSVPTQEVVVKESFFDQRARRADELEAQYDSRELAVMVADAELRQKKLDTHHDNIQPLLLALRRLDDPSHH